MNIFEVEQNTYFADMANRKQKLNPNDDFLLSRVAMQIYADSNWKYCANEEEEKEVCYEAFNEANENFITNAYLNIVRPVLTDYGWAQRLFLYNNGSIGAELSEYADAINPETGEEEETKVYRIELY